MDDKKVAVAIVIGNDESFYGFSFLAQYYSNPLKVTTSKWTDKSRISHVLPTCVLFTKNKVFHSFGYVSKDKYFELSENKEHIDWYFFDRFLSCFTLEERPLSKSTNVTAIDGKELLAIDVILPMIKGIKDHAIKQLESEKCQINAADIQWVLSISASWREDVRWFWKTATKTGIFDEQFRIVSEEEAAIWYYKHVHKKRVLSGGSGPDNKAFSTGSKYIVLNCKEEAVFLTAFEVNNDTSLKELYKTSERTGGGRQIYNAFEDLLTDIVGASVIEEFSRSYPEEYAIMYEEFHSKCFTIGNEVFGKITIKLPVDLVDIFEEKTNKSIKETIDNSKFSSKLLWCGDKCRFTRELFHGLFKVPSSEIIALVNNVIEKPEIKGTKNIIMIGTFAELPILQTMIKQALPGMKVIITPEAKLSSLIGAVIYGHEHRNEIEPKYATSRVDKFIEKFQKRPVVQA